MPNSITLSLERFHFSNRHGARTHRYDCWGEKFETLYEKYEKMGKGRKTIKAQKLWFQILESQIETGTPYMLFKDACNSKSNQQNLGTIRSSNLCTEIIEYTAPDEVAVCNLASINLSMFVDEKTRTYDFKKLVEITKQVTYVVCSSTHTLR